MAAWLKICVAKWLSRCPHLLVELAGGLALAPQASAVALGADLQPGTAFTYDGTHQVESNRVVVRAAPIRFVDREGSAAGLASAVGGYLDDSFVAPGSTRVYSSGADALEGGAISLDDAARVAADNGIDMRAISLQYVGGAPSNLYGFTSMDGAGNIVRAPDGRYIVTLTDAGLSSPGSALNTIAHELNHIREISRTPGFHIPEEAGATLAGDLAELYMRGG